MTPLIDGDVLLHEIGWSGQFKDKDTGEEILFDFDRVSELLDDKIKYICEDVGATKPPIIFLTDNQFITDQDNKEAKRSGNELRSFVPGFRYEVAVSKPYKGQRKNPKPFHFYNLIVYMRANYETRIAIGGLEADDLICQHQYQSEEPTIVCSRDKDLRICPGWHYSWECGGQRSVGPIETDEIGWLELNDKKVIGYGKMFFYYQMLVGDAADNIPGLPGTGQAKAFKFFENLETEWDLFCMVKEAYKNCDKIENSKEYFMEQANLLWMRYDGVYKLPKKEDDGTT